MQLYLQMTCMYIVKPDLPHCVVSQVKPEGIGSEVIGTTTHLILLQDGAEVVVAVFNWRSGKVGTQSHAHEHTIKPEWLWAVCLHLFTILVHVLSFLVHIAL